MSRFNYVPIKLVTSDAPVNVEVLAETIYACFSRPIPRNTVIGAGVSHMTRSPELDIMADIVPVDGKMDFELILRLPFWLPAHRGMDEYGIKVGDRLYVVNNRQVELVTASHPNHFFFCHLSIIPQITHALSTSATQVISIPTVVSSVFTTECSSASSAIEENANRWFGIMAQDVSQLVASLRYHSTDPSAIPEVYHFEDRCPFMLVARAGKKHGMIPLVAHTSAGQIRSHANIEVDLETVQISLKPESRKPHLHFLDSAKSHLRNGDLASAAIFACTACEAAITHLLVADLRAKGLGSDKRKMALNDLRFSQQLNLISHYLPEMSSQTGHIPAINRLRKTRNDIVHNGAAVTGELAVSIRSGIQAIESFFSAVPAIYERGQQAGYGDAEEAV